MRIGDMYALRRSMIELESIREAIAELETRRTSPKVAAYGREAVQGSRKGDINAENIARIDALMGAYNSTIAETTALQAEFEAAISCLKSDARVILRKYFLTGKSWEKICVEEEKSYRQIMRIWREARDQLSA